MVNYSAELDREEFLDRTGLRVIRSSRVNILGYSTVLYCARDRSTRGLRIETGEEWIGQTAN